MLAKADSEIYNKEIKFEKGQCLEVGSVTKTNDLIE
jgi:hypothetical protein